MNLRDLDAEIRYYQTQHTTPGCKLTHLIGVPMIAFSLPLLIFRWRSGVLLFLGGWFLQFVGHYAFEKNSPIILSKSRNAYVPLASIIVIYDAWVNILKGSSYLGAKGEDSNL